MMGMESGKRSIERHRSSFDASVDEGTFGDYEVFGVSSSDDRSSEYEIFIVATPRGLRGPRSVFSTLRASDRDRVAQPYGP